jgi:hypothetical protein
MKQPLLKFVETMSSLKDNRKALAGLITLDLFMAVASNIVDWPWLMSVKWYLWPVTPICSLYPLTLTIWFGLRYAGKRIPAWFTNFIFIGIISYGIMANIYYPVYMAWDGIQWRMIGNMVWVAVYALQSFIIASEVKRIPVYQYILVIGYFVFKDYADRYLGSFIDILREDFPESLKNQLFYVMLLTHAAVVCLALYMPVLNAKRLTDRLAQEPIR